MYNMAYGGMPEKYQDLSYISQEQMITNRFIYVKNTSSHTPLNGSQKVLVNPHFKSNKVFVNPKFSRIHSNTIHINPQVKKLSVSILSDQQTIKEESHQINVPLKNPKIHINPNARSVQIPLNIPQNSTKSVHINPNFKNSNILSNITLNNSSHNERKNIMSSEAINKAIVLTRTKLIRAPIGNKKLKRRNSVKSNYKIVKSSLYSSKNKIDLKNSNQENKSTNIYKIDRRRRTSLSILAKNQKKYVYVNRFFSISDLAKNCVIKNPSTASIKNSTVVNISGVMYKKSRMSLRRASNSVLIKKSPNRPVQLSKYKLVKKPAIVKKITARKCSVEIKEKIQKNNFVVKKFKIIRRVSPKKHKIAKVSLRKLRTCNIPCPYYKKYGTCKGKENGKCFRKHDPDQIALCTRFLQGACIKENCLLSHNVSPEKMPTCKYYLEGSCSKENCPYLHVRISPKAEVCRDFLEGFCKKAAECDKRHQYLCPDYEKYGECFKQRCPYPHGKMVRNYFSNKIQFAKKCSDTNRKITKLETDLVVSNKIVAINVCKNEQVKEKQRYYNETKSKSEEISSECTTLDILPKDDEIEKCTTRNFVGLQSRPKLGTLPAFIPFIK